MKYWYSVLESKWMFVFSQDQCYQGNFLLPKNGLMEVSNVAYLHTQSLKLLQITGLFLVVTARQRRSDCIYCLIKKQTNTRSCSFIFTFWMKNSLPWPFALGWFFFQNSSSCCSSSGWTADKKKTSVNRQHGDATKNWDRIHVNKGEEWFSY